MPCILVNRMPNASECSRPLYHQDVVLRARVRYTECALGEQLRSVEAEKCLACQPAQQTIFSPHPRLPAKSAASAKRKPPQVRGDKETCGGPQAFSSRPVSSSQCTAAHRPRAS